MKVTIIVGGRWHAFDLARELNAGKLLRKLVTNYPRAVTRRWGIPDDLVVSLPATLLLERVMYRIGRERAAMKAQYLLHSWFANSAAKHLDGSSLVHGWSSFSKPAIVASARRGMPFLLERSSSHMAEQCKILSEEHRLLGLRWEATHPKVVAQELWEYEFSSGVSVPSTYVKQTFLNQGFPECKLFQTPFGVDTSTFVPAPTLPKVFTAVYAGSISVRKGIHYLCEGFVKSRVEKGELLLVGGKSVHTNKLVGVVDSRIRLEGHVNQSLLPGYYQRSSVFVMASIEEGLAYVQAQALACGLPLICTENTGGEDLLRLGSEGMVSADGRIREYAAGYVVPIRDPESISSCLNRLYENPEILRKKRAAALRIGLKQLSWRTYATRLTSVYERLIRDYSSH